MTPICSNVNVTHTSTLTELALPVFLDDGLVVARTPALVAVPPLPTVVGSPITSTIRRPRGTIGPPGNNRASSGSSSGAGKSSTACSSICGDGGGQDGGGAVGEIKCIIGGEIVAVVWEEIADI